MAMTEKPVEVRPTLVVGLGGTGVLVCCWLEHYIRKLTGGSVPPFIRFLKLDTDAVEEGGPLGGGLADFVNLFHYLDLGEVVRDARRHPALHPHLDWLRELKLNAAFAEYGCKGIPRLGRVVFMELQSKIQELVNARFNDLYQSREKVMTSGDRRYTFGPGDGPVVHFASSVCGGTGAGMLIDMAYGVQRWSQPIFRKQADVVAHLVLPEAFAVKAAVKSKLDAVAGATLEQLEFLTGGPRRDMPVTYKESFEMFEKETAPFSFIYLLNGYGAGGGAKRRHLVRMIAAMIRAMILEPARQHIASDANNQLTNTLGTLEPKNGRLRCFASYGLWRGVSGRRPKEVDRWIYEALSCRSGAPARAAPWPDQGMNQVRRDVDAHFSADEGAKALPNPDPLDWRLPSNLDDARRFHADIKQDIQTHLHVYGGRLESAAKGAVSVNGAGDRFVAHVAGQIKAHVQDDTEPRPIERAARYLADVQAELDRWRRDNRGGQTALQALRVKAIQDAVQSVREANDSDGRPRDPYDYQPQDVNDPVNTMLQTGEHAEKMKRAACCAAILGEAESALAACREMARALSHLAALADERLKAMPVAQADEADAQGGPALESDEPFSTPVRVDSNPATGGDTPLARAFRDKVLVRLLDDVVLRGPTADPSKVQARLNGAMAVLQAERLHLAEDAEAYDTNAFFSSPEAGRDVTEHEYYAPVLNIRELAQPRIDLISKGRFEAPQDVVVAQAVEGTCLRDLLARDHGESFREAVVAADTVDTEKVWFLLLHLSYGFNIEALAAYEKYREATEKYKQEMNFTYGNCWLDQEWFNAYCRAKRLWQTGVAEQHLGGLAREAYEAWAAESYRFCILLCDKLGELDHAAAAMRDVGQARQAMRFLARAEADFHDLLFEVRTRLDELEVNKDRCCTRWRKLAQDLHSVDADLAEAARRAEKELGAGEGAAEPLRPEQARNLVRRGLEACKKGIESVVPEADSAGIRQVMERHEPKIHALLEKLTSADPGEVREIWNLCLGACRVMLLELDAQRPDLRDKIRERLGPARANAPRWQVEFYRLFESQERA